MEAVERYQTPLYLLDLDRFSQNYSELEKAYKKRYSNFKIAYSFKTNYTPVICKQAKKLGGYAEVVSELEYHMAKRYGFKPSEIIINGPGKISGIQEMVKDGALIMLDNSDELDMVIQASISTKTRGRVGFRVNCQIGAGKESRFGFDVLSEETEKQIKRTRESQVVDILGIHFHLSGARSLAAWKKRAEIMTKIADDLLLPQERQYIDLGSGMFGHMDPQLASQFDMEIPSFDEYAEAVTSIFKKQYNNCSPKPLLIVEPGTTIVANTMEYITKILSIKTIRERNIAIVDGSVHQLGEIGKKKQLPLTILSKGTEGNKVEDIEITGYTCLEDDILYRRCDEPVGRGDYIVFGNAGAYSNVLKPPFIQQGCKMVVFDSKQGLNLCKREEQLDDILISYI